ncbi:MAG: hypothetical protein HY000_01470 [Planctomycetes bacterium]|nr:hypothetical protein [Planctomycetota bacterium]
MVQLRSAGWRGLSLAMALVCLAQRTSSGDEVASLVARIKAVRNEGEGNSDASRASKELARRGPESLIELLQAMDDATPIAANWLRAAFETIAERAFQAGRPLPRSELEEFVTDRSHAGPVRRLAYEWLARVDPSAPDRLIPGMLDDPSVELRRDAVARELKHAGELLDDGDEPAATVAYEKIFSVARDRDQVELIAQRLTSFGQEVDLAQHYGFIQHWRLIGPFDNTDKTGFDAVYPPERKIELEAEHRGKESPVRWTEHTTSDPHGMVDLNKVLSKHMGVVAYALGVVESPDERPVQIRAGSNNAVKIWLNGQLLFFREEYHHGLHMDQHRSTGTLRPGRNTILIKVCQNEQTEEWAQSWSFQVRVCDVTGGGILHKGGAEVASRVRGPDGKDERRETKGEK